jgi:hypothetical protein
MVVLIDATAHQEREIGAGFDRALQRYEERSLELLRELARLANSWPTDTLMFELLHRHQQELVYLVQRQSTQLYLELSRARQQQT